MSAAAAASSAVASSLYPYCITSGEPYPLKNRHPVSQPDQQGIHADVNEANWSVYKCSKLIAAIDGNPIPMIFLCAHTKNRCHLTLDKEEYNSALCMSSSVFLSQEEGNQARFLQIINIAGYPPKLIVKQYWVFFLYKGNCDEKMLIIILHR